MNVGIYDGAKVTRRVEMLFLVSMAFTPHV